MDAIYLGEWQNYDMKSKRALLILMERCKIPLSLSAEGIFDLSFGTFVSVGSNDLYILRFPKTAI